MLLANQVSRERMSLVTCAECKIVNTSMADDKCWPGSRLSMHTL